MRLLGLMKALKDLEKRTITRCDLLVQNTWFRVVKKSLPCLNAIMAVINPLTHAGRQCRGIGDLIGKVLENPGPKIDPRKVAHTLRANGGEPETKTAAHGKVNICSTGQALI